MHAFDAVGVRYGHGVISAKNAYKIRRRDVHGIVPPGHQELVLEPNLISLAVILIGSPDMDFADRKSAIITPPRLLYFAFEDNEAAPGSSNFMTVTGSFQYGANLFGI